MPTLLYILGAASALCAASVHAQDSTFGLTFGANNIYASRFNASGHVEVTIQATTQEYQAEYAHAIANIGTQVYDGGHASSMFSHALRPLFATLKRQLRRTPVYSSLFLPSIFHYTFISAANDVVFTRSVREQARKSGWAYQAACGGYRFLECQNLGRPRDGCSDEGPQNLVLVLEYEDDYVYAWLLAAEFELGTYIDKHSKFCKHCGEGSRKEIGEVAYKQQLAEFLDTFINTEALNMAETQDRDEIRAIIVAGQASERGNAELREIARQAVGTGVVKVLTEIEAAEVVAHGAAVWAQTTDQFPDDFISKNYRARPDHDEL